MHSKALFQCNTTKWKTNNTNHNNCSYNLAFCDFPFQNPSYLSLPPKEKSLLRFTDVNINKLLIISSIPVTFLPPLPPAVIVQLLMLNIKLYIFSKSIPWFILYSYYFLSWYGLKLRTKRGTSQTAHLTSLCSTILLASNFPSPTHSPATSHCKWKVLQMRATDTCCCLPKAHQP